MNILITGAAGFIGAHSALHLLKDGHQVTGLDNFNAHYDPQLKHDRVRWVAEQVGQFPLRQLDLNDAPALERLFAEVRPQVVIHLATQPGGRCSQATAHGQPDCSLAGLRPILDPCRRHAIEHLIYAAPESHCSCGAGSALQVDSDGRLQGVPATALRFLTVYGPWGRPDMAPHLFARAICEELPLKLFNHGLHQRDFSYIDDVVHSLVRLLHKPPSGHPQLQGESPAWLDSTLPRRLFNIGGQRLVQLKDYVATLEQLLGRKARFEYLSLPGADRSPGPEPISALENLTGFGPQTPLAKGLGHFVEWFHAYYRPGSVQPTPALELSGQNPQPRGREY